MREPLKLADEFEIFTEEENLYRSTFRTLFARELNAETVSAMGSTVDFRPLWRSAAASGLVGIRLPERFGGAGASEVFGVAAAYEMGRTIEYATVGGTLATDVTTGLLLHASDELTRELAPRVLGGEITCMAMTEPDAGSNLRGIRTRATRHEDEWILNGSKCFVTMGDCAELIYVLALTDPDRGLAGLSLLAVDANSPGVTQRRAPMLGLPVTGLGEIHFSDVRVPRGRLVGEEGAAVRLLGSLLAVDRTSMSAEALGQAELAIELAVEFARTREIEPGRYLIDAQHTRMVLADMITDARASAAFLHHNVERIRSGRITAVDGAACKNFVAAASARIVDAAVQLHGAAGLSKEYAISHVYASNRKFKILAGTTELLDLTISRHI